MPAMNIDITQTTFVYSALPNKNMSSYPFIYVGTNTIRQKSTGLLQLDLSSIPSTHVDGAFLELAVTCKTSSAVSPIYVHRVTEPFVTSSVTYNTAPAYAEAASSVKIFPSDLYSKVKIDVTELVNSFLGGAYPNYGLALTNPDDLTAVYFAADNSLYSPFLPKLTVNYAASPEAESAVCFSYNQLANVLSQIITYYPNDTVTVFTKGFAASSVTGTPYQLYSSPDGTYGGIFILLDNGVQQAVPLNSIAAVYTGDGTVYNPSMSYLTPQHFPEGCGTNIVTAIHDYLPVSTEVQMYMGSNISASGAIYKNEYGMLVLSDSDGSTPVFIPIMNITAIVPSPSGSKSADGKQSKTKIAIVSNEKNQTKET